MAEVAASVEIVPSKGDADGSRMKEYEAMYQYSITRPEEFWAKVSSRSPPPRPPSLSPRSARRRALGHSAGCWLGAEELAYFRRNTRPHMLAAAWRLSDSRRVDFAP